MNLLLFIKIKYLLFNPSDRIECSIDLHNTFYIPQKVSYLDLWLQSKCYNTRDLSLRMNRHEDNVVQEKNNIMTGPFPWLIFSNLNDSTVVVFFNFLSIYLGKLSLQKRNICSRKSTWVGHINFVFLKHDKPSFWGTIHLSGIRSQMLKIDTNTLW